MATRKPKTKPSCVLRSLPEADLLAAADVAVEVAPTNAPQLEGLTDAVETLVGQPAHLAVLTSRYWGAGGVDLGVSFTDSPSKELIDRILSHMNAWGQYANVKFRWSLQDGQVRITRGEQGYWSYLGTDVLLIPKGRATMCLQGFTMATAESEYKRVVRHETGHSLGFPHEHLRSALVARLDPAKTLAYFEQYYGWSESQTRSNVLTPLEEWSLMGSPQQDETSIMTYFLPGECTKNGQPIPGGSDLSAVDKAFVAQLYPGAVAPPPPAGIPVTVGKAVPQGKWFLTRTALAQRLTLTTAQPLPAGKYTLTPG